MIFRWQADKIAAAVVKGVSVDVMDFLVIGTIHNFTVHSDIVIVTVKNNLAACVPAPRRFNDTPAEYL
jgi:hypothetical protein